MHQEDCIATLSVGQGALHDAVKPTRAQQSRVKQLEPAGEGDKRVEEGEGEGG